MDFDLTITAAGEILSGQDFVVTADTTTSSPSPSASASASPTATASTAPTASPSTSPASGEDLPNTGNSVGLPTVLLGVGLVLAGLVVIGATGWGRRRRH